MVQWNHVSLRKSRVATTTLVVVLAAVPCDCTRLVPDFSVNITRGNASLTNATNATTTRAIRTVIATTTSTQLAVTTGMATTEAPPSSSPSWDLLWIGLGGIGFFLVVLPLVGVCVQRFCCKGDDAPTTTTTGGLTATTEATAAVRPVGADHETVVEVIVGNDATHEMMAVADHRMEAQPAMNVSASARFASPPQFLIAASEAARAPRVAAVADAAAIVPGTPIPPAQLPYGRAAYTEPTDANHWS